MMDRVILVLAGGMAFWAPTALVAILWNNDNFFVLANTLPVLCAACLYGLLIRVARLKTMRFLPIYMLAGIYLLGPLAIMLTTATIEKRLPLPASGQSVLSFVAISVFPPLTMLLAGDSGVILALLAITVILVVAAVRRTSPGLNGAVSN